MDVDLRKVRYFVAVAETLNFGRAAAELHIAQPVLSRQIRALETELHAQLFVRDRRGTELTAAGRQLLADAVPLLAEAQALRRRTAQAARGTRTFTVAFMPGVTVTAEVRSFRAEHPDVEVDVLRTGWHDQTTVLLDGRADVSYVRLPVDQRGLTLLPLFTEPRVVVMADDHPLAGKETLALADLAGEHLLQDPDAVPEWRDVAEELRDGRRAAARSLPVLATVEEKLEHVAAGLGIVVLPQSVATFYTRPDVTHAVVDDLPPNRVCLARDAARRSRLVSDYAKLARAVHRGEQ